MWTDEYDLGPIRPPSEANSLLIRINRNCPWNKCEFCNVYKNTKFEKKSIEEIKSDIDKAATFFGDAAVTLTTAFLQDANALVMKTGDLIEVIIYLQKIFPAVRRITTYARADTVARKSEDELNKLRAAGLNRLHIGLESGCDEILEFVSKGTTQKELIEAGQKAKRACFELSMYVMPGLGGKRLWTEHAVGTARVLNAVAPDFIRLRSLSMRPGTPLHDKSLSGNFALLGEAETVAEIKLLIEKLECCGPMLVSDHFLNLLPEIEGRLPDDKPAMLSVAGKFLAMEKSEQENFVVGVRTGVYRKLDDMLDPAARKQAERNTERIRAAIAMNPGLNNMPVEIYIRKLMESVI